MSLTISIIVSNWVICFVKWMSLQKSKSRFGLLDILKLRPSGYCPVYTKYTKIEAAKSKAFGLISSLIV